MNDSFGKSALSPNGPPMEEASDYRKIFQEKERMQKILENKVKELDRSNKELEEFAYIASHDLQEPLRKITSFSERLREKLPEGLGPEVTTYLDRMQNATANMRMLIENLLEFSRISRSGDSLAPTDLNAILKEAKAELELNIEETRSMITSGSLPTILAIGHQMKQLFTNLLSNAIKFKKLNEPAMIHVSATKLTDEEKEANHIPDDGVYYDVLFKDEGIGFEPEFSLKIFQIFQRLHGKAEYPGSGIGLAICKKIVENHKGNIFAVGCPGEGASFHIILPEAQTLSHD